MARVMRQKQMHHENFSLKKYGSWNKAMSAARLWVKKKLPKLPRKFQAKAE
jgi:hypothetical protein